MVRHISNISFPELYASVFQSQQEAEEFYKDASNNAKVVLHQAGRMIWLADRLDEEFTRARPAIQIMFYIIAAEHSAKLLEGYDKEGQSKAFVTKFFKESSLPPDAKRLEGGIFLSDRNVGRSSSSLDDAITFLYKIRCDVSHRGRYHIISFPSLNTLSGKKYEVTLSIGDLRTIILRTVVEIAKKANSASTYSPS